MATLVVPPLDKKPWPTLGPQLVQFLRERSIYGPGSLKGLPYEPDVEFEFFLYRAYEVYPKSAGPMAGRRRFKRVGMSIRKGLSKTEKLAQLILLELHPESPVRCDGFDARGNPVGRPVRDPYIPILSVTVEQVEELAFGALYVLATEGPDADLFDSTLERIVRLGPGGKADGKAVPLANNPGARDGARTTFQGFDEPHRLILPRQKQAHETMVANLEKRVLEDPWGCYVGTAGEPGEGSVAEELHAEGESIQRGEIDEPALFYLHREAGPGFDLTTREGRVAAIKDATVPLEEYGPGQFESIAKQWERPKADRSYLERVWTNRWTRSERQAFDIKRREKLRRHGLIKPKSFVTVGFDGARFRDSTGIVITDIPTGLQQCWAYWERPLDLAEDDHWEVPEHEVTEAMAELNDTMVVWRGNCDPPHWVETVGSWSGTWDWVEEWWTNRTKAMAYAVRNYREGMDSDAITFAYETDDPEDDDRETAFARHAASAGRADVNFWDDDGRRLYVLRKIHPERRFDIQMAAVLSWEGRLEALRKNAKPPKRRSTKVQRLR